jgi:TonB-dependent starch-binding outer membrane protein SusC
MKMNSTIAKRGELWLFLLVFFLIVFAQEVVAQSLTVSGTVKDENSIAIPGVSVIVKGTSSGTTTDEAGKYVLEINDGNVTLIYSFIGYTSQEIAVNNRTQIDVSMLPDVQTLSEVVVVGYGTQRKTDLTGAITSIKGETLREMPVTSMEQTMQGRLAGVQVQQSSGQPGGGISIRVRGVSSIAGGNEPLYVIDGLPQFNDDVRAANGLATINPSDIESIEVLKDAAATAIYGSRGANGVVMITTKSGKSGQPKITFESSVGFQEVRRKLRLMETEEYIQYAKNYYINSSLTVPGDLESFSQTYNNTDWQEHVFNRAAMTNNTISISGGNDRSRFFISTGYLDQRGIVRNTGYKRISARLNLDSKISDRFSVQSRLTVSRGIQNGFSPSVGDNTRNFGKSGIGSIMRSLPVVPIKNEDGSYTDTTPFSFNGIDAENPIAITDEVLDQNTTTRIQGGIDLKADIIKGLKNTVRIGGDYSHTRRDLYFPKILPRLGNNIGAAELGLYDKTSALIEDFLEYKYDISEGTYIEAIAGGSLQRERFNLVELAGSGFGSDDMKNYNLQAANSISKPITDVSENTIISAFGRVRFNYQEKYLLAASIRRDGASVFAENSKYGIFPSVSAGWRISEEAFLKGDEILSNLKLRASWGQAGNPAIKPYQSLLLGRSVNTGQGAGTGLAVGLAPTLPNPDLKWETTTQTNIGIDAGVMNEKFRITFDYYIKTTSDLLALVQLPPTAGVGAGIGSGPGQVLDNVGEVENKGWELTLGANVINSSDWTFSVDVNFSQNNNRVTKTKDNKDVPTITGGNDASGSNSIIRPGEPLSAFYGPKYLGLDEDQIPVHLNVNGDTTATGADIINALDNVIIGNPYPKMYYGLNTMLKYKRFTLTTTWTGVSGSTINNAGLFDMVNPTAANQFNKLKAAWEYYPTPSQAAANRHLRSSRYMESGDYFRLRNIRLDYNFNLGSANVIKNLNIYFTGQNLLTITDYSGFDPEVNTFSGNDRRQGVDLAAYPAAKTYTIGLSATF